MIRTVAWSLASLMATSGCALWSSGADAEAAVARQYTTAYARTFDDSITPTAFGLAVPSRAEPDAGDHLTALSTADLIVAARVITVAADETAEGLRFHLTLRSLGSPLAGTVSAPEFRLAVSSQSPSQSLLKTLDTELVGRRLLLFISRFEDGSKMVLHFRAEADTKALRTAVLEKLREIQQPAIPEGEARPEP